MATTKTIPAVTSEQMDAAWRVVDDASGEVFYRVASATDFEKTYTVRSVKVNGKRYLTCTCPAGRSGTPCWHKRAAVAHAEWYKSEQKALAQSESAPTAMDVVNRREHSAMVNLTVREGHDYHSVCLYKDAAQDFCWCSQAGEHGAMPQECAHLTFARQWEAQYHTERADYLATIA